MTTQTLIIETIGVLGFLTNVWANILLARKHESGWLIRLVANALWLVFSIAAMSFANLLSSGVFAVINVYGWRRWRKERLAMTFKPTCLDHYRIECAFCHEIVRQCICHSAKPKQITRNGLCGACKAQVIPPIRDIPGDCRICGATVEEDCNIERHG